MSFFKFTALTIAIDACDVAIIAPRTVGLDTDSTVLMARGQSVLPALTPAEAAAEVDATVDGDPLMAGPYDTLEMGDGCYFGGRQVQRIAPTADGLGCVVTFGNVPAVLTVPDVDVDTMTDELNATGECGGGAASGVVAVERYIPVCTGLGDVTCNAAPLDAFNFFELQATEEGENLVNVTGSVNMSSLAGVTDAALATVSLPIPMSNEYPDGVSLVVTGNRWQLGGLPIELAVTRVSDDAVSIGGTLPAGVNVYANLNLTYNRGAS